MTWTTFSRRGAILSSIRCTRVRAHQITRYSLEMDAAFHRTSSSFHCLKRRLESFFMDHRIGTLRELQIVEKPPSLKEIMAPSSSLIHDMLEYEHLTQQSVTDKRRSFAQGLL